MKMAYLALVFVTISLLCIAAARADQARRAQLIMLPVNLYPHVYSIRTTPEACAQGQLLVTFSRAPI